MPVARPELILFEIPEADAHAEIIACAAWFLKRAIIVGNLV